MLAILPAQDWVVELSVALIALLGTLLGIYFGYRQWAKGRRDDESKTYREERRAAYKAMWLDLEQISVENRMSELPAEDLQARVQRMNATILKNSIYISEDDAGLAQAYLKSACAFHASARSSGDPRATKPLEETASIPAAVLRQYEGLQETHSNALKLRRQLVDRIQAVLEGR